MNTTLILKSGNNGNVNKDQWTELLERSKFSSPFQTPEFYQVLKNTERYNSEIYTLSVAGKYKAVITVALMKEPSIKGFFSRRGIIFGGPVLDNEITEDELMVFLKWVSRDCKGKAIYLETRNFYDYSKYKNLFEKAGWYYEPYLNFHLILEGLTKESLIKLFDNDVRRRIKNSISEGATYTDCNSLDELKEAYVILKELYKNRVNLPLPRFDFFRAFYKSGLIKIFLVKHNGKIIGGSFCPYDENGIYTFYYCDMRNYHRRISPTHLSILAAMEFGLEKGIPKFDFMGAGKPGISYGVRDFKKQFGGEEVEHGRFIKVLNPFLYKLGKIGIM